MTASRTNVVVVGAGPVGLVIAIGLAQRGVPFVILDALKEQQNTSRAAVIHARTLDALRKLGVAERLIAQGIRVPHFRIRDRSTVLLDADFGQLATQTPFTLMIPQDETEAILIRRLAELGHYVKRPTKATGLELVPGIGARLHCETPGEGLVIESQFVVGADGMNSKIREWAGIAFPGTTYGSFLLADVRMGWPISSKEVTLFFSKSGTLVVAPMSHERYRVVAQLEEAPSVPTCADVQRLIDQRGPVEGAQVSEILWGSRFQVHHKLASTFRKGPILLAGDAAHVHSPAGGQGMNLGIRDGVALADALSDVLINNKGEEVLDRYSLAQREAARSVLAMTDRLTRVATIENALVRQARNRALRVASSFPYFTRRFASTLAGY